VGTGLQTQTAGAFLAFLASCLLAWASFYLIHARASPASLHAASGSSSVACQPAVGLVFQNEEAVIFFLISAAVRWENNLPKTGVQKVQNYIHV
jgi:hypothetical protein